MEILADPAEEFKATIAAACKRWTEVIKGAGIRAD